MNVKSIVAAVALGAVAFQASADGDLGTIPPSVSFSATHTGAFEDIWTFNLDTGAVVAASLTNVEVSFFGASTGGILDFAASLNGEPLLYSSSTSFNDPVTVKVQVLAGAGGGLFAPGMYQLKVSGSGVTGGSASYGGNLVAAPIPEPETYAMMLAGLGAIGFMAARRRRQG